MKTLGILHHYQTLSGLCFPKFSSYLLQRLKPSKSIFLMTIINIVLIVPVMEYLRPPLALMMDSWCLNQIIHGIRIGINYSGPRNCTILSVSVPRIFVAPYLPFSGPITCNFQTISGPRNCTIWSVYGPRIFIAPFYLFYLVLYFQKVCCQICRSIVIFKA